MIFVTVGTHEQPFNRLIKKIDELKKDGIIITVTDIDKLEEIINYNNIVKKMNQVINSYNKKFNDSLEQMVEEMFEGTTHE